MRRGTPVSTLVRLARLILQWQALNVCFITLSIKREIGHLCHDERRSKAGDKQPATNGTSTTQPSTSIGEPVPTYPPSAFCVGLATKKYYADPFQDSIFPSTSQTIPVPVTSAAPVTATSSTTSSWSMGAQPSFLYRPDTLGNEFAVLTCVFEPPCIWLTKLLIC